MNLLDVAELDQSLREYQTNSKIEIYKAWESTPSVMFQMPTGTGKTRLFSSIIKDTQRCSHENHERYGVLVLAHRTELIEQIDNTLSQKYNIAHGIIKSGYEEDLRFPVQVASVQTLTRRIDKWQKKAFSYIIIDEAHHAMAKTYRKICNAFPDAKILGVTATPYRLSGESFRDLFGALILSQGVNKFIEQGYLSQYEYYSIRPTSAMQRIIDEIDDFGTDGDYSETALINACDKDYIRASLVDAYKEFAFGKKGIIYTINHAHSQHVCEAFQQLGLNIVIIDSDTSASERKKKVSEFRAGKIDIICNVNIFSEGFDCPDIEFIQLARPTMSLAMYLQQVGRGLRPCSGKEGAVIIDNVGLFNRFGLPSARRQWKRHFEGKKDIDDVVKHNKKRKGGSSQTDFDEGDEQMQLVYSFGKEYQESVSNAVVREAALDAFSSAEHFPMGILGEVEHLERNYTIESIKDREDFTKEQKIEAIRGVSGISSLCRSFEGVRHFQTVEELEDYIEDTINESFIEDYDELQKIENKVYQIFKFKYDGKYGIGKKKVFKQSDLSVFGKEDLCLEDLFDILLEPVYDEIELPDAADQIVCKKDGKAGLIHGYTKTEILPFKYEDIMTVSDTIFCVCKKGKWGLLIDGELVLNFDYDFVYPQKVIPLFQKYVMVEKDGKFGLCNIGSSPHEVRWQFPPAAELYNQHYGAQTPSKTCAIVDSKGNILSPFLSSSIIVTYTPEKRYLQDAGGGIILNEDLEFVCNYAGPKDPVLSDLKTLKVFRNNKNDKSEKPKRETPGVNSLTEKSKKDEFKISDDSILLIRNGKILYDKHFEEVRQSNIPDVFICKKSKKYGLIKATEKEVVCLAPITYTSVVCNEDGTISLINDSKKQFEEFLFNPPVSGSEISLVSRRPKDGLQDAHIRKRKGECKLIINNCVVNDFELEDAEPLFGFFFKFKQPFTQWGIFRVNQKCQVEIVRNPIYTDISVLDAKQRQLRVEREGKRPAIITLK